jgi:hypothetical protein
MPDLPIDQLPSASALQPTNVFPVVQSNVTKQAPYSFILYAPTNNYGLFNQTGSSTPVVNTTSELSLIGGGVGTLTVPANSFTQGDAYNAIIGGNVSAQNLNTTYSLDAFAISQSWSMGTGQFAQVPESRNGVSWTYTGPYQNSPAWSVTGSSYISSLNI